MPSLIEEARRVAAATASHSPRAAAALEAARMARLRNLGRHDLPRTVWVDPSRVVRRFVGCLPADAGVAQGVGGDWDQSERLSVTVDPSTLPIDPAALARPNPDLDPIDVIVDRHGRIVVVNGAERMVAAGIDVAWVSARVLARHRDWVATAQQIRGSVRGYRGVSYQPLAHPDLRDVDSAHREDRLATVLGALPTAPASVLDLGCNWGYFSIELARRGYAATGVEQNERTAYFARRLIAAADVDVTVINRSMFDVDLPAYDAVLALSVFHHFLKRPELQQHLVELLGALPAGAMIFQPHVQSDRGMQGLSWNPGPEEFAEWVADHAGLRVADRIGVAADERPLFLLHS